MTSIVVILTVLVAFGCAGALADGLERAAAHLHARRQARRNLRAPGRGPAGSSPAAGPGPTPTSEVPVHRNHRAAVEAAIEAAWQDHDLYRKAGRLPGERDYRTGGTA